MSSSGVIAVWGVAIVILITMAVIVAVIVIAIAAAVKAGKSSAHQQNEQPPVPVPQPIPMPAPEPEELSPAAPQQKLTLGETIKNHRIRCGMTQEYVAEALNVSRQAVSKWETDSSDPSTSNLLALAKLFGISAAELLDGIE